MKRAKTRASQGRGRFLRVWVVTMVLVPAFGTPGVAGAVEKAEIEQSAAPPGELIVAMEEIPVWEVSEQVQDSFLRVGYNPVQEQKQGGRTYPEFKSATPLYGQVYFEHLAGEAGRSSSLLLALDHSEGKADTYDLLYLDQNGDGDLTNDPPQRVWQDLPEALAQKYSHPGEHIWFEPVKLIFDFGPAGHRPIEVIPRLWIRDDQPKMLAFVPANVHTGTFEIAGTTYRAFLGYQYTIGGRLDQPGAALILAPEGAEPFRWWGGDELRAIHRLGDRHYRVSCTPTGDQVFIRPYDGKLGILEVGAGGRNVKKLEMAGSLYSQETAVAVGDTVADGWPEPTQRCAIPVGDYYPAIMSVSFDHIRLNISNNYHTNAQGQPRSNRQPVAGITIREGKPYVLDFSNKPVVVFEEPKEDRRIRRGDEVKFEAVLIDPVLDIMIRGLDDTADVQIVSHKYSDGTEHTFERPRSLDPKVLITRADGEVVAEGAMPFG